MFRCSAGGPLAAEVYPTWKGGRFVIEDENFLGPEKSQMTLWERFLTAIKLGASSALNRGCKPLSPAINLNAINSPGISEVEKRTAEFGINQQ